MRTIIDDTGKLEIPEEIRQQAGIRPGTELDVRWHNGRIEIETAPTQITLVRKGRFLVAVAETDGARLTSETVEDIRQAIYQEREESLRNQDAALPPRF
jgi:AbrB family looped-hinge helix DNA binding protein